ncbi:MFS transporter [Glycomyces sp. TRM65418]|uniref:MFS transporter n=1 Tax=Glycomyces sp. TRM65418 TaxID=2867006 RepID=UPI001CE6CFF0|nr:MFS transporter [Glycomyces sp. TRM65418]MCC3765073.1 MFS transporter [Glycomyces sp. TRM65418]QZD54702.1 MFS transporter [Glycomyces sp. TRM65418]
MRALTRRPTLRAGAVAPPPAPFLAKLLVSGAGIMSLANSITMPFLAVFLRRELGLDPAAIGLLIGSSVLFSITAGFLGGTLSDVFGRAPVLLAGLLGVVASFIGFFVAEHVLVVFACVAAMALSTSSFAPVGKALLSDLLPEGDRVRWFSYQYLATNVGYAVGPLLGVALGLAGGRAGFLAAAIVYGVYLAVLAVAIRTTRVAPAEASAEGEPQRGMDRFLGSFRAVAGDMRLLCFLAAGLLLEAVHLRVSVLLAQDLDIGFADGTRILAAVMTTNAITVVVFQLSASKLVLKRDPVTAIVIGALLMFAGMAGFAVAGSLWQFVAAMVVFSIGETFIVPSEFAVIDRIAPPDRRGAYFGAQTFTQLGGFVGPFLGGVLLSTWNGAAMFLGVGSLALLSSVAYLTAGRRIPGLMGRERGASGSAA